jgi:hypothetical protein
MDTIFSSKPGKPLPAFYLGSDSSGLDRLQFGTPGEAFSGPVRRKMLAKNWLAGRSNLAKAKIPPASYSSLAKNVAKDQYSRIGP